jgi:hypothetical protein
VAVAVNITRLFPRPRPVTLGGRTFLVGEMRLRDLVDLQDFLDRRWESPLEAIRPKLGAMDDRERKAALRGLWAACEAGPVRWGTDAAAKAFRTAEGILETFRIVLRIHHPELTLDQVTEIASRTTPEEFDAMLSSWRRIDPIDELAWMLGMDEGAGKGSIGWAQAVCELCETYGWTLDYVMTLTLRQISTVRSGGKPQEKGIAVKPGTNLRDRVRAMRRELYGDGHATNGKGGD